MRSTPRDFAGQPHGCGLLLQLFNTKAGINPFPRISLQPKNVMAASSRKKQALKGRLQRLTTSLNAGATAPPQTFFIESHAAQLRVVKEKRLRLSSGTKACNNALVDDSEMETPWPNQCVYPPTSS
ncbi:MAG: hypothetical protein ACON5J_11260 [Rubripirellula sp.]